MLLKELHNPLAYKLLDPIKGDSGDGATFMFEMREYYLQRALLKFRRLIGALTTDEELIFSNLVMPIRVGIILNDQDYEDFGLSAGGNDIVVKKLKDARKNYYNEKDSYAFNGFRIYTCPLKFVKNYLARVNQNFLPIINAEGNPDISWNQSDDVFLNIYKVKQAFIEFSSAITNNRDSVEVASNRVLFEYIEPVNFQKARNGNDSNKMYDIEENNYFTVMNSRIYFIGKSIGSKQDKVLNAYLLIQKEITSDINGEQLEVPEEYTDIILTLAAQEAMFDLGTNIASNKSQLYGNEVQQQIQIIQQQLVKNKATGNV